MPLTRRPLLRSTYNVALFDGFVATRRACSNATLQYSTRHATVNSNFLRMRSWLLSAIISQQSDSDEFCFVAVLQHRTTIADATASARFSRHARAYQSSLCAAAFGWRFQK